MSTREVHLINRPVGLPNDECFDIVEVELPTPEDGQVSVQNLFFSVDPYMRGRMRDVASYSPPYQLGTVMHGGAVGEVTASEHDDFAVGDLVQSNLGWREAYTTSASSLVKLPANAEMPSHYLGVLGMPGLTAYVGTLHIGQIREGDTFFVSGAAGAVGSVAGQIAKLKGCRVIGTAGSDDKCSWLTDDLGFDVAINYRDSDLVHSLSDAAPDGVDVYFDNVGYEHLEAAIALMNEGGRIAACGSISGYNEEVHRPGPSNLSLIVGKRINMRGFIVSDHSDLRSQFLSDMSTWMSEGKITTQETVVEGIENAAEAFRGLFAGTNVGKMVVKL